VSQFFKDRHLIEKRKTKICVLEQKARWNNRHLIDAKLSNQTRF